MVFLMTSVYFLSPGPFSVIDEHFNSILPNCYDAIGVMLMIRIIHQHQVMFQPSNLVLLCI